MSLSNNNSTKAMFLDVDSSITENNLRFVNKSEEEEFNKMFGRGPGAGDDLYPSKIVKPFPGFSVKTKEIGTDQKLFVNICYTDAIPPPDDITERELEEILSSDAAPSFRVPMSIGDIRAEIDKKGDKAKVCDVAINPKFYQKIDEISLFKSFFMTIVFEGLKDKYGVVCVDEKIILKNRKVFGTLQSHRIQQRDIEEKMGKKVMTDGGVTMTDERKRTLIEELNDGDKLLKTPSPPVIETVADKKAWKVPEYRLFRRQQVPNCVIGEFKFPDVISAKELVLDVGEDRILVECNSKNYLLDVFVPFIIRQKSCTSSFEKSTKILTVTMPLMGG